MYKIILASQSPRRRQLLEEQGLETTVYAVKVSEIIKENLSWNDCLLDLAGQKLEGFLQQYNHLELQNNLVLTADTLVIFENRALGKPENEQQARDFLREMSGKTHEVKTSVLLYNGSTGEKRGAVDTTVIHFRDLSQDEIDAYVQSGEPMDKAGAYGIQGEAGKFVDRIEGSFSNVVGLPVELFTQLLKDNQWNVCKK